MHTSQAREEEGPGQRRNRKASQTARRGLRRRRTTAPAQGCAQALIPMFGIFGSASVGRGGMGGGRGGWVPEPRAQAAGARRNPTTAGALGAFMVVGLNGPIFGRARVGRGGMGGGGVAGALLWVWDYMARYSGGRASAEAGWMEERWLGARAPGGGSGRPQSARATIPPR
ncbi:hypothetical protein K438DRAFT_1955237 [Mycena galopus ATCC 62051]|nr:hypothetical protein K438DRAFT_1955237 [Mycena galopus ATCC 62051]